MNRIFFYNSQIYFASWQQLNSLSYSTLSKAYQYFNFNKRLVSGSNDFKNSNFYENILLKGYNSRSSCNLKEVKKVDEKEIVGSFDSRRKKIQEAPNINEFVNNMYSSCTLSKRERKKLSHPYIKVNDLNGYGQKVYFKVYGCQMNVNDSEIAWSILKSCGYNLATNMEEADVIFIVTCSIREGAENKIWSKLKTLRALKNKYKYIKIGVLGCMAERIGPALIEKEKIVDIVAGPDSYKDLPRLLALAKNGEQSFNILLSHDETYANVNPVSLSPNKCSAYVSIMRGCDNMCTYCIVPFTRGRERSRQISTIKDEIKYLSDNGIKEVTLLGQNVNSYRNISEPNNELHQIEELNSNNVTRLSKGFKTIYKNKVGGKRFSDLLDEISLIDPEMRIRFTSPHPKDFPDDVLHIIKERPNICNNIHLPAQCGSSRILELMQRGYTREAYLELVLHIRSVVPEMSLSSDFICGFCSETEEEFEETLSLMEEVKYNYCFIFPYSTREKTVAHRRFSDDVPLNIKKKRVERLNTLYRRLVLQTNMSKIGERHLILIEGQSKRSEVQLIGRNDGNTKVIVADAELPSGDLDTTRRATVGDYVEVVIADATSEVLKAIPVRLSSIKQFYTT